MSDKKLRRKTNGNIFLGLCAGFADFFDIQPWMVRLMFIFLQFTFVPSMILIYLVACLLIPKQSRQTECNAESFNHAERADHSNYNREVEILNSEINNLDKSFDLIEQRIRKIEDLVARGEHELKKDIDGIRL